MKKSAKTVKQQPVPSIEDLFVMSSRQTIEMAMLLQMSYDNFVATMNVAWKIIDEQVKATQQESEEVPK